MRSPRCCSRAASAATCRRPAPWASAWCRSWRCRGSSRPGTWPARAPRWRRCRCGNGRQPMPSWTRSSTWSCPGGQTSTTCSWTSWRFRDDDGRGRMRRARPARQRHRRAARLADRRGPAAPGAAYPPAADRARRRPAAGRAGRPLPARGRRLRGLRQLRSARPGAPPPRHRAAGGRPLLRRVREARGGRGCGRAARQLLPDRLPGAHIRPHGLEVARPRPASGAARRLLPRLHPGHLAGPASNARAAGAGRAGGCHAGAAVGGAGRGRVGAGGTAGASGGMSDVTALRAALLPAPGTPLRVVELELAAPGPGEVLVRLRSSGVCQDDLNLLDGTVDVPAPVVPGHEGAGVVEALGEGVAGLALGDHVALSWAPYCGSCEECLRDLPHLCGTAWPLMLAGGLLDGTTRLRFGGAEVHHYCFLSTFAERAVVPARSCVQIPSDVPFEVAALLGCAVTSGVGAVWRTAGVRPGERVAVIGTGGTGLSAVMGPVAAGASQVIAS